MTNQDLLIQTISRAKCTVASWATELLEKERYGGDIVCCESKMLLLSEWITIAEFYNCQNYGDNGNITPDIVCLSADEIELLISKMIAIMK